MLHPLKMNAWDRALTRMENSVLDQDQIGARMRRRAKQTEQREETAARKLFNVGRRRHDQVTSQPRKLRRFIKLWKRAKAEADAKAKSAA